MIPCGFPASCGSVIQHIVTLQGQLWSHHSPTQTLQCPPLPTPGIQDFPLYPASLVSASCHPSVCLFTPHQHTMCYAKHCVFLTLRPLNSAERLLSPSHRGAVEWLAQGTTTGWGSWRLNLCLSNSKVLHHINQAPESKECSMHNNNK